MASLFSIRVASNPNDCYAGDDGSFSANYYQYGNNSAGSNPLRAYALFQSFPSRRLATISTCVLTLKAKNSRSGTVKVKIYGDKSALNPSAPTTKADLYARSLTTAYVSWTCPNTTGGNTYSPADLSTIVQELVNQSGWAINNSIGLVVVDDGSTADTLRDWIDYNDDPANAALLSGTYVDALSGNSFIMF